MCLLSPPPPIFSSICVSLFRRMAATTVACEQQNHAPCVCGLISVVRASGDPKRCVVGIRSYAVVPQPTRDRDYCQTLRRQKTVVLCAIVGRRQHSCLRCCRPLFSLLLLLSFAGGCWWISTTRRRCSEVTACLSKYAKDNPCSRADFLARRVCVPRCSLRYGSDLLCI